MAGTETTTEGTSGTRRKTAEPRGPQTRKEPQTVPDREHVCNVAFCPIGLALSTVQGAAPDVMEHLLKAAQEFFLAARAVMENRANDFEDAPSERRVERIEIS